MLLKEIAGPNFEWRFKRDHTGAKELCLFKNGQYAATFVYKVGKSRTFSQKNLGKWEFSTTGITGTRNDPYNDANNTVSFGTTTQAFDTFADVNAFVQRKGLPSIAEFEEALSANDSMDVVFFSWTNYNMELPIEWLEQVKSESPRGFLQFTSNILKRLRKDDHRIQIKDNPDLVKFYDEGR